MQGRRHESEPRCGCDPTDLRCAALAVRQLSQDRARELAEEIWARSTGSRLPASPSSDPRRSRPGASAFAAYRRYRQLERAAWRPGWASLDHLVVGGTGVWLIRSWRPSWPAALRRAISPKLALGSPAGMARGLREEAAAVADALAGATTVPVRALLCAPWWPWPASGWPVPEVQVTTPRRLADAVGGGSRVRGEEVDHAAARALEVLRPAA
jgi:hypothetical protein